MTEITQYGLVCVNTYSESYYCDFIARHVMPTSNVTAELESEFPHWWYGKPIFISAPTGSGKSTFIVKTLIDHVIKSEQGGQVLIVYNRLALGNQYKELVLKEYNPELRKRYTSLGLQETDSFDGIPVRFSTYQGLVSLLQRGAVSIHTSFLTNATFLLLMPCLLGIPGGCFSNCHRSSKKQ